MCEHILYSQFHNQLFALYLSIVQNAKITCFQTIIFSISCAEKIKCVPIQKVYKSKLLFFLPAVLSHNNNDDNNYSNSHNKRFDTVDVIYSDRATSVIIVKIISPQNNSAQNTGYQLF